MDEFNFELGCKGRLTIPCVLTYDPIWECELCRGRGSQSRPCNYTCSQSKMQYNVQQYHCLRERFMQHVNGRTSMGRVRRNFLRCCSYAMHIPFTCFVNDLSTWPHPSPCRRWVMLSICCVNSSQQPSSQQDLLNQLLLWERDGVATLTNDGLLDGERGYGR